GAWCATCRMSKSLRLIERCWAQQPICDIVARRPADDERSITIRNDVCLARFDAGIRLVPSREEPEVLPIVPLVEDVQIAFQRCLELETDFVIRMKHRSNIHWLPEPILSGLQSYFDDSCGRARRRQLPTSGADTSNERNGWAPANPLQNTTSNGEQCESHHRSTLSEMLRLKK